MFKKTNDFLHSLYIVLYIRRLPRNKIPILISYLTWLLYVIDYECHYFIESGSFALFILKVILQKLPENFVENLLNYFFFGLIFQTIRASCQIFSNWI